VGRKLSGDGIKKAEKAAEGQRIFFASETTSRGSQQKYWDSSAANEKLLGGEYILFIRNGKKRSYSTKTEPES